MAIDDVLTESDMIVQYGEFFTRGAGITLDEQRVPEPVRPLTPYAKFWGISDDGYREDLVAAAPPSALDNLKSVVARFGPALDHWLAGPEACLVPPSAEYVAFSAMRMAADFA